MLIKILKFTSFCFLMMLSFSAAKSQKLFARASGYWSDPSNWSLSLNGGSCNCFPRYFTDVVIPNNTTIRVDMDWPSAHSIVIGTSSNNGEAKLILVQKANLAVVSLTLSGTSGSAVFEFGSPYATLTVGFLSVLGNNNRFLQSMGSLFLLSTNTIPSTFNYFRNLTISGPTIFDGAIKVGNLTINSSTTFNKGVTVTDTLKLFKGIVTMDTSTLTLVHGSTVLNASNDSYVNGKVKKIGNSEFTFPVGTQGVYGPITMDRSINEADAFTVEYFRPVNPSTDITLQPVKMTTCEHWNITRDAGTVTRRFKKGHNEKF